MTPSQEPGRRAGEWFAIGDIGSGRGTMSPLDDIIGGFVLAALGSAAIAAGISIGATSAFVFFGAVAVLCIGFAIWLFVHAHRRQVWRTKYSQRTGSPRLKIWERLN